MTEIKYKIVCNHLKSYGYSAIYTGEMEEFIHRITAFQILVRIGSRVRLTKRLFFTSQKINRKFSILILLEIILKIVKRGIQFIFF